MTTQTILLLSVGALLIIDLIITIYTFRATEEEIGMLRAKIELDDKVHRRYRAKVVAFEENLCVRRDEILSIYNDVARLKEIIMRPKKNGMPKKKAKDEVKPD